ncbi:MAG: LTA synthase family protein, partial [Paenisporosarcina sp.]
MIKSPILLTAITIAIVIAKVFYFRYELFNDLSLTGLVVESILWLLPYFVVLLLLKKHPIPFMIIISLLSSILMLMITWYERYFLIVPSYFDLSQTGQAGSIVEILPYLYATSDVFYFMDTIVLIVALVLFRKTEPLSIKRVNIVIVSVLLILSIIIPSMAFKATIYDVSSTSKKYGYLNTQITQSLQRNFKESEIVEVIDFDYEKVIELKN